MAGRHPRDTPADGPRPKFCPGCGKSTRPVGDHPHRVLNLRRKWMVICPEQEKGQKALFEKKSGRNGQR